MKRLDGDSLVEDYSLTPFNVSYIKVADDCTLEKDEARSMKEQLIAAEALLESIHGLTGTQNRLDFDTDRRFDFFTDETHAN